ncbi:MAG TPA: RecX family transcriptional regulator, partial [Nitrospiria bacterium]|nr:RecX family transcriptional regulator [Nitrospiria bacterium]
IGRDRVALELKVKGIAKELIEETLVPLYNEMDEQTLAQEALKKKQRTMKRSTTASDHRRLTDFLRRRGFSYEAIRKALKANHEFC